MAKTKKDGQNLVAAGQKLKLQITPPETQSARLRSRCESALKQYREGGDSSELKILVNEFGNHQIVRELQAHIAYIDGDFCRTNEILEPLLPGAKSAELWYLSGRALRKLGLLDSAVFAYENAVELNPNLAHIHNEMGIALRYLGERSRAVDAYRSAISLNPDSPSAYYNLSCVLDLVLEQQEENRLRELQITLESIEDRALCCFALYNSRSNAGQGDAFSWLVKGNALLFRPIPKTATLSFYERKIEQLESPIKSAASSTELPIPLFLVGLPRSGSSLLEKLLGGHPSISTIGENDTISQLMRDLSSTEDPVISEIVPGLRSRQRASDALNRYTSNLLSQITDSHCYVDKTLNNMMFVGFIKALLPHAKFVHLVRDATDNCFSCYEKKFTGDHPYSYDLDALADHYIAHCKLMATWKRRLPEDIIEIRYEGLVNDPEREIKRCLDLVSISSHKETLQTQHDQKPTITASTEQVRRPLYRNSIGKSRKYKEELRPLISKLEEHGYQASLRPNPS